MVSVLWGGASAALVGIAKTGVPGAAMPAVAMMAEAFPDAAKLSVGALLPILLVGDLFAIRYYRRHADWARLVELFPYVAAGMVPGCLVLWRVHSDALRMLLGIMILVLLIVHIGWRRWGERGLPDRWWFVAASGFLAGFGTTVGNAAGPVMSVYLVSKRLDKHAFLGTAAWFFFFVNLSKLPLFVLLGMITPRTLRLDLILVPLVVAGALLGAMLLKRISQRVFDAVVLSLAALAALRLVIA